MKLDEFRKRWVTNEEARTESIEGSRVERIDDFRPSTKQSEAQKSIRFRSRYVPGGESDARVVRLRGILVRVLTLLLAFTVAAIVLAAMFDYLLVYLKTYVLDR